MLRYASLKKEKGYDVWCRNSHGVPASIYAGITVIINMLDDICKSQSETLIKFGRDLPT